MASRSVSRNPVFRELTEIQRYTDVDPNPEDSDFSTCRAMRRDGGRCRNPPCTQYERWQIPSLLSEFREMTEFPDTESFYDKLETFVTYTHCKRWHRPVACNAVDEWKRQRMATKPTPRRRPATVTRSRPAPAIESRPSPVVQPITITTIQPLTAAALQLLPSTPTRQIPSSASATSDGGSSFDDSVLDYRSETSNTTFLGSFPNTPSRNEPTIRFEMEEVVEEEVVEEATPEEDIVMETVEENAVEDVIEDVVEGNTARNGTTEENDVEERQDPTFTVDIQNTTVKKEGNYEMKETIIQGIGVASLQRNGSLRDHSPVFQVINTHPTSERMKEGVVYILEHKENPSLFKIGWSSKSAEERLHQPNNCYGINTKIIYETKRFCGAPQAEKIAQVILRHANIRVLACDKCKGGHREWFAAQRDIVCDTVKHVEEFVQMPAYTLQDGEYKLSPEAYNRVVKQMCNFSVHKLGELMHGTKEEDAPTEVPTETTPTAVAQFVNPPSEISRPSTRDGLEEEQEIDQSQISTPSSKSKSQKKLTPGAKVARKMKRFLAVKDSVKGYLTRSQESTPEIGDEDRRSFGSFFTDLKDKAREVGTKARQEARDFKRDFKEELRRKDEEQPV